MAETTNPVGPMDQWGTTWLIVTGASRGLGSAICEGFASQMAPNSVIVAFARSKTGLDNTEAKVKQCNPQVKFVSVVEDLGEGNADILRKSLRKSLDGSNVDFERAMLVHNAGSLKPLEYLRDIEDFNVVKDYFNLNVSSLIPLTKIFLDLARSIASKPLLHVINITSLSAISPTPSWGLYCIGKAARDMAFKVLATEEGSSVHVLNYAPGPLDNDMMVEARTQTKDPQIKIIFESLLQENKLLKMEETVGKLAQILKEGKYVSGDHVDYFD